MSESYDLSAFVRNQLRQAAAEFILEQVATVADEITGLSEESYTGPDVCETCGDIHDEGEDYIPEVTYDQRGVLSPNADHFRDIDAWVRGWQDCIKRTEEKYGYQTDQDNGDVADVARQRSAGSPRRFRSYTPPR